MNLETPMQQAFNDGRYIRAFHKAVRAAKRKNYRKPRIHPAQPGEISLKRWKLEQAEREETTVHAIEQKLWKGQYPRLSIRRVNKRVIFVKPQPALR